MKSLTESQKAIAESLLPIAKATARRFGKHPLSNEIYSAAMLAVVQVALRADRLRDIRSVAKVATRNRAVGVISRWKSFWPIRDEEIPIEFFDRSQKAIDDSDELDFALSCIPNKDASILKMIYIEEIHQKEVGRRVGCSQQTVSRIVNSYQAE